MGNLNNPAGGFFGVGAYLDVRAYLIIYGKSSLGITLVDVHLNCLN